MIRINTPEETAAAMMEVSLSLERRFAAKKIFCEGYNEKNVVKYIKNL